MGSTPVTRHRQPPANTREATVRSADDASAASSSLRILQVHTFYRQTGGEDHVVKTDLDLLRGAGHEVHALRAANPAGASAIPAFGRAAWNPSAARRIRGAAERFQPDVIHVHNTWFALTPAVFPSLRELGVPIVMTLHNYRLVCAAATLFREGAPCHDCLGSHPWHAVRHRCYRDSRPESAVAAATIALHHRRGTWHRDVDLFIALSEFGRQRFIDGGLPDERVAVKANVVDDPGPRPEPPSSSRSVLFVGRLAEEKGVATLLDAWAQQTTDLELIVAGTGPLESALRARAPSSVRFVGAQPHDAISELMIGARALVFPSIWYEGQPLVPLEAAAAGLPVLLSDLGAMTEMFAPGAEELLVPPGDPVALAERIDRLEDDAFVDRLGATTRARFEARHHPQAGLERLEEIYRSVL